MAASPAGAATLKSIGSFEQPIFVTSDPVEPERLFVVERPGRVAEVVDGGLPRLYADLTPYVSCCAGERGLLSIALAPDFRTTGRFYAAYTGKAAAGGSLGDIHVDSFVAGADGKVTRSPIISIDHHQQANHNGGQLQFGPDGYLYISTGDGGGGGDPFESGQNLNTLLGKVLRIDPHPGSTPSYSIPPGNPFAATAGADEIWAYGLRNPWRFSFDSLTGDMVIGDVGQDAREEVDLARSPSPGVVGGAGANYGWSCREGFSAYTDASPASNCVGRERLHRTGLRLPAHGPRTRRRPRLRLRDHRRLRGPRSEPRRPLRPLRLRRLLRRRDPLAGAAQRHCARRRSLRGPQCLRPGLLRRRLLPQGLRGRGQRRLPLRRGSGGGLPGTAGRRRAEQPPAGGRPGTLHSPTPPPAETGPAEIKIGAERRGERLLVSVRVSPCATWVGEQVQLNRGGREVGVKRLDEKCGVAFRIADPGRATFRALLVAKDGSTIRSRRFVLGPPAG